MGMSKRLQVKKDKKTQLKELIKCKQFFFRENSTFINKKTYTTKFIKLITIIDYLQRVIKITYIIDLMLYIDNIVLTSKI